MPIKLNLAFSATTYAEQMPGCGHFGGGRVLFPISKNIAGLHAWARWLEAADSYTGSDQTDDVIIR